MLFENLEPGWFSDNFNFKEQIIRGLYYGNHGYFKFTLQIENFKTAYSKKAG